MTRLLTTIVVCLALLGCGTPTPPAPEIRVIKPAEPPVIVVPTLDTTPTTSSERARALAQYINDLRAALTSALTALDAYRGQP